MNYEFNVPFGQNLISNDIFWQHTAGSLPPGAVLLPNGKIRVSTNLNLISFTKKNIFNAGYPRNDHTSDLAWDSFLKDLLSVRTKLDYEFTVQLSKNLYNIIPFDSSGYDIDPFDASVALDNTGTIYYSHTIRIVYFRPPFVHEFFSASAEYLNIDLTATYFLVLTSFKDHVTWTTEKTLGSLINGRASELAVEASTLSGKTLEYQIKPNYYSRLPLGTKLLSNGLLSGRVSFRCSQDDPINIPNDQYEFIARAQTANGFSFAEKFFTVSVNRINLEPSNNIKIRAFPTKLERIKFDQLVNDENYFPSEGIYRLGDPWFGKIDYLSFLFVPGVKKQPLVNYINAIEYNHKRKDFLFDTLQTACAVDENLNVRYEVVYLTPIDDLLGRDPDTLEPKGEPDEIDLREFIVNFHMTNGQTYYILRPDGFENMRSRINKFVTFSNYRNLPDWMISVQPIPDKPGRFRGPIGFVPAIVLAYTKPGYSKLISYRLKDFIFNKFKFEFDRYQLDQYLTEQYDYMTNTWIAGSSVEFDSGSTLIDKGGTIFSDGLEYYHVPGYNDKYLKFPLFGVFK